MYFFVSQVKSAPIFLKKCNSSLSYMTTFMPTLCAVSSGSPPLMRIPFPAPTPVPTMTAVGVAKPNEHGHAIHRTVMAKRNACSNIASCLLRPRSYS